MSATLAVTDLTYSKMVEGYIHEIDYKNKSSSHLSASSHGSFSETGGGYGSGISAGGSSDTEYHEYENRYSYIEYGELRGFTGDIKKEILNSRMFEVVQPRTGSIPKDETAFDIIGRIKKEDYSGADFVLFGIVNQISFNNDTYQSSSPGIRTNTYNLTISAEFSVIDTRTYQVISSFSAQGDGADTKIQSSGTSATPNRAMVVSEVSKTLGKDVFEKLSTTLKGYSPIDTSQMNKGKMVVEPSDTDVMVFTK
jgi:hypothetical protein